MDGLATILVADDEITFLQSTAYFLRNEGYQCDCAGDAHEARQRLAAGRYDLLIADIHMPGNDNLSLIRDVSRLAAGMPIIVVTGYPTIDSAIDSVHLPVVAYLTKPLEMAQLLDQVHAALEQVCGRRLLTQLRQQVNWCATQLASLEQAEARAARGGLSQATLRVLDRVVPALADVLGQLHALALQMAPDAPLPGLCQLLQCSQRESLQGGLREAIQVIERTKAAFKSKDLANLRVHLQHLLQEPRSLAAEAGSSAGGTLLGPHVPAALAAAQRIP